MLVSRHRFKYSSMHVRARWFVCSSDDGVELPIWFGVYVALMPLQWKYTAAVDNVQYQNAYRIETHPHTETYIY